MDAALADPALVWDTRCDVAESCVWDAKSRRILFTDSQRRRILGYSVDGGAQEIWELPDHPRCFAWCASGRLVVAFPRRVVLYDLKSHTVTPLSGDIDEPAGNWLNDGRAGPDGCFWVGVSNQDHAKQPTGGFYRITPAGQMTRVQSGFSTFNGLAWSPDGGVMFYAETYTGAVYRRRFDPKTGATSDHKEIASLTREDGRPDGAACDADGAYWSAGVTAGCLNKLSPDGALLAKIRLPFPAPSMPCFADDALYITTLRKNRSAEILAQHPTLGGLFRMKAPAKGAEVARFADV